jgi:hypothetical protein
MIIFNSSSPAYINQSIKFNDEAIKIFLIHKFLIPKHFFPHYDFIKSSNIFHLLKHACMLHYQQAAAFSSRALSRSFALATRNCKQPTAAESRESAREKRREQNKNMYSSAV